MIGRRVDDLEPAITLTPQASEWQQAGCWRGDGELGGSTPYKQNEGIR